MTCKTRKMFPGGNTANGFYSFFDYIIPNDVNRIFCLKGGPGVGKSSFMKIIALTGRFLRWLSKPCKICFLTWLGLSTLNCLVPIVKARVSLFSLKAVKIVILRVDISTNPSARYQKMLISAFW